MPSYYVLKGGISWRMLPREFAPWKTVYHYFRLWRLAGLWDRIHDQLRDSKGRHICPSAAIVDSQSVATQQKGAIGATMLMDAKNPAKRVSSAPGGGGGACFDRAGRDSGVFVSGDQHPEGGRNEFCRHQRQSQSIGSSAGQNGGYGV